jgi:hypothetical protein
MKKKVIIALYGLADTGKTTTLRKLALEFLESPDVKEDIQVGFLYNKERPTKVVVSTTKDPGVNTDFYTGLTAQTLILTTTRIKDKTVKINGVPELVKKEDPDPEQEKIDDARKQEIKERIEPIAKESSTLHQFSQKLLASDVVEGDIQIAFHYKGKRILISTAGDTVNEVDESTKLFGMLDADILVTATRNVGRTDTCLRLRNYGEGIKSEAIWISKCGSESLNEVQAKKLRAFIDLIIDNWDN